MATDSYFQTEQGIAAGDVWGKLTRQRTNSEPVRGRQQGTTLWDSQEAGQPGQSTATRLWRGLLDKADKSQGGLLFRADKLHKERWQAVEYVFRDLSDVLRDDSKSSAARKVLCRKQPLWENAFRRWAKFATVDYNHVG
jgi:hypothetical protein